MYCCNEATTKLEIMTTLNEIFESELFQQLEREENETLESTGWTRKDIDSIANMIIKNS